MDMIINILEQGLIFSVVALGVYISYRILDFPDLSVDGTFPLGGAVAAVCLMKNINPFAACALAALAGALGGLITGLLHVKLKITNLLCGILVMIALYSINLRIMSKANVPLFDRITIFSTSLKPIIIIFIFTICAKLIVDLFLKTKLGFILTAVGDNENLVTLLGVNKGSIKILGLMLSNALVALGGAMMAQYQGYADVNMGTGTVVMGLAAVIIGESIFKRAKFIKYTSMAIWGAIAYKAAVAGALRLGLPVTDLKLITAVIVIGALTLNTDEVGFKGIKKLVTGGAFIVKNSKLKQSI